MKPYSPIHTITTTAKREVQILLLKKGTIITLVILLLAILGVIGFATWQKDKDESGEAGPAVAAVGVDAQLLNDAGARTPPGDDVLTLATRNDTVTRINGRELARLPGRAKTASAEITGDFGGRQYPADADPKPA